MSTEKFRALPDWPVIQKLGQQLYTRITTDQIATIGRAAVMIGAGFSRQAHHPSPTKVMPLWEQLIDTFLDQVYPGASKDDKEWHKRKGFLRIAQEYEAALGRQALDERVRVLIDDEGYRPSELHSQLLRLPWSDVFTTNYDRLLERTAEHLLERRYTLVTRVEDLPSSSRPRIVKLHGTLPSAHSFILTEEDYRRYPQESAGFVNTVRQSLLENTLCLMGFSGSDPNFLQWLGWVKDILGSRTPRVLLFEVRSVTRAERLVLHNLGVDYIDLSPVVDEKLPGGDRYRLAYQGLLSVLEEMKPRVNDDWPNVPFGEPWPPRGGEASADDLRSLINAWRKERETYPGWILCPTDKSGHVLYSLQEWMSPTEELIGTIGIIHDIALAFEWCWRCEMVQLPLMLSTYEVLTRVVDSYDLTKRTYSPPSSGTTSSPQPIQLTGNDWNTIKEKLLFVRLVLARSAREDYDLPTRDRLLTPVRSEIQYHSDLSDRLCWDDAHLALMEMNSPKLREVLKAWSPHDNAYLWRLRRAGLMRLAGGDGQWELAKIEVEDVLKSVRFMMREGESIEFMSLVGMALSMLQHFELKGDPQALSVRSLSKRQGEMLGLAGRRADLTRVMDDILRQVDEKAAQGTGARSEYVEKGFEPGSYSLKSQFVGFSFGSFVGSRYLRAIEDAGMSRSLDETSQKVVGNMWSSNPAWVASHCFLGSIEIVKKADVISRSLILSVLTKSAGEFETFCRCVTQNLPAKTETPLVPIFYQGRSPDLSLLHFEKALRVVTRWLSVRGEKSAVVGLVGRLVGLMTSSPVRQDLRSHSFIPDVCCTLIKSLDLEGCLDVARYVLTHQIPDFDPHGEAGTWRDPAALLLMRMEALSSPSYPLEWELFQNFLDQQLGILNGSSGKLCEGVAYRIYLLSRIFPGQVDLTPVRNHLWHGTLPGELAKVKFLQPFALLLFAEATDMDLRNQLCKWYTKQDPTDERIVQGLCLSPSRPETMLDSYSPSLRFSPSQIGEIFEKICAEVKGASSGNPRAGYHPFVGYRTHWFRLMTDFFPHYRGQLKVDAAVWISYVDSQLSVDNFAAHRRWPGLVALSPDLKRVAVDRLIQGLASSATEQLPSALLALRVWATLSASNQIVPMPDELVNLVFHTCLIGSARRYGSWLTTLGYLLRCLALEILASREPTLRRILTKLEVDTQAGDGPPWTWPVTSVVVNERTDVRAIAAHISAWLSKNLPHPSEEMQVVLTRWENIRQTSALPEVRLADRIPLEEW